jgi:GAF domain-containing protein
VVTRDQLDLTSVFGAADTLLMKDTLTDRRGSVWSPGTVSRAGEKPRSALGVRLRAQDRTIGYLLVGALGPSFFRREDLTLLEEVGALVVARVETLLLTWQEMVLRGQLSILRSVPAQLAKLAEILATTPQLPDALRAFKGAAASILSFETLTVAVTVGDEDHVIILEPGDATPLKELTPVGIAGTPTARVIRREMAYAFTGDPRGTDLSSTAWLVVPLRVGGQIVGALNVLAPGSQVYNRADVSLAQQIADVAAPHLQLIRRSAGWTLPLNETWGRGRGR